MSAQGGRHDSGSNRVVHWKKPPESWIKYNVDGGFMSNAVRSKAGWGIHDHYGRYHERIQAVGKVVKNPLESEMHAILMVIQHAWSRGYQKVCIESNSKKAVDVMNGNILHFDAYNWKSDIQWWKKQFKDLKFHWINREGNKVADKLVKQQIEDNVSFKFYFYVPTLISTEIHNDYVSST